MSRRPRNPGALLSLEGLTDAVTNLTGTLILLAVLVVGMTRGGVWGRKPTDEKEAYDKIGILLDEVERLKLEIGSVDEEVRELEGALPDLESRLEALRQRAEQVPAIEPPAEPPAEEPPPRPAGQHLAGAGPPRDRGATVEIAQLRTRGAAGGE